MPSQSRSEAERFHLLATIVTYPSLSTQSVRDLANNECQHDSFDPLPLIAPQAITGKLKALERGGLVESFKDIDGLRWDPTDAGRQAWEAEEAKLDAVHVERINGR